MAKNKKQSVKKKPAKAKAKTKAKTKAKVKSQESKARGKEGSQEACSGEKKMPQKSYEKGLSRKPPRSVLSAAPKPARSKPETKTGFGRFVQASGGPGHR